MLKCIYLEKGAYFFVCFLSEKHTAPPQSQGLRKPREALNGNKIGGAKMAGTRNKITLACTECKQRNYNTKKNKKNDPDRIELNKYCRFCRKHTLHKETK